VAQSALRAPFELREVPRGPVAFRRRLQRLGPIAGLIVPAGVLAAAVVVWRAWPCDGSACWTKGKFGFVLAEMAAPTLLAVGYPLQSSTTRLVIAGVTSAIMWMVIGGWAAARAVRSPVATWRDWTREYVVILVAVWAGVVGALVVVRFTTNAV
jgi:hypothetical protein